MCFKEKGAIFILGGKFLKLIEKFTYFDSSISSTKSDVNIRQVEAWNAIDRLSFIRKSDLSDLIK